MTTGNHSELRNILMAHAQKYPRMGPCDAVKLIYQNEFGGGHLITDKSLSLNRLRAEYESVPHDKSRPLWEEIGNGLVRVMLDALDLESYPLESLNEDFVRSASLHRGDRTVFLEKLDLLKELSSQGVFSFSPEDLNGYLREYVAAGCPMVSHSEGYRSAYHPAYRVVRRDCLSL